MAEWSPEFLHTEGDGIVFRVQRSLYGDGPIAAAVHRFTDRCFVHLENQRGGEWVLCRLVPREKGADARNLAGSLANEFLDQYLRARVAEETEPVRRLLLAQVFSRTNVFHPELDGPSLKDTGAPDERGDGAPAPT